MFETAALRLLFNDIVNGYNLNINEEELPSVARLEGNINTICKKMYKK